MSQRYVRRRSVLAAMGTAAVAGLAGCSGDGGGEVRVGPDGSLAFEPESLTVSAGTTVNWRFEGRGHNVSCRPEDHERVTLPEGAEPFASHDGDAFATSDAGTTFSHALDAPGTYEYVCVPHAASGMTGTVRVRE